MDWYTACFERRRWWGTVSHDNSEQYTTVCWLTYNLAQNGWIDNEDKGGLKREELDGDGLVCIRTFPFSTSSNLQCNFVSPSHTVLSNPSSPSTERATTADAATTTRTNPAIGRCIGLQLTQPLVFTNHRIFGVYSRPGQTQSISPWHREIQHTNHKVSDNQDCGIDVLGSQLEA